MEVLSVVSLLVAAGAVALCLKLKKDLAAEVARLHISISSVSSGIRAKFPETDPFRGDA